MITHGIRALFLAQSAITTLAPAQTVNRVSFPSVFCDNEPQGINPPFILIHFMGTDPLMTLDPTYHASGQIDSIDVECVCWNLPAARTLNKVVREFFEDYSGNVTADGVTDEIKAVTWLDESYDYSFPQDGTDGKQHSITTSYSVHLRQGV